WPVFHLTILQREFVFRRRNEAILASSSLAYARDDGESCSIQRKGHDSACPSNFQFDQAKVTPLFCSSPCRRSPANQTTVSFLDRGRAVSIARRTSRVSPDRNTDLPSTFPHSKRAFPPRFSASRCDRPISRFRHRWRQS